MEKANWGIRVGSDLRLWGSASSGGIEDALMGSGLELRVTSASLAQSIGDDGSASLLEQLGEYASRFPQSREHIVEALDTVAKKQSAAVARKARRKAAEILALTMLEAIR